MKRYIVVLGLSFFLALPRASTAQWKKIFDFGSQVSSVYFLDLPGPPRIGFVGTAENAIWKTTDGGTTWLRKLTQTHSGLWGYMSSITFKDTLHGWCSFWGGIYETTDGGDNWRQTIVDTGLHTVCYCPFNKTLYKGPANSAQSTNDGATWTNLLDTKNVIGFSMSSSGAGIITTFAWRPWLVTTDFGRTWTTSNWQGECHEPLMIAGTGLIFTVWDSTFYGEPGTFRQYNITGAFDGVPLSYMTDYHQYATGCVRGSLCQMYVQCQNGVDVSTDQGLTWKLIGGPGNYVDTRFWVRDDDVYAGDGSGGLWHLNQRYRASLPSIEMALSKDTINLGSFNNCSDSDLSFPIRNLFSCDDIQVDTLYLQPSPELSTLISPLGSHELKVGMADTLRVRFAPQGDSTYLTYVNAIVRFDSQTYAYHIPVKVSSYTHKQFAVASDTLRARMCDSVTGFVTLQNTTCGDLEVDSISMPLGMTLPPGTNGLPQLPLVFLQGKTRLVTLHFAPSSLGDTSLKIIAHVRFIEHGVTVAFDTLISLSAVVARGIPAYTLSTSSLEFGSVSSCGQSRTMPIAVSSVGCDTLICSGTVPVPPFTISKSFANSLPVGSADSVEVTFAPTTTGEFYDTLVLQTNAGSQRIAMHGTGIRGGKFIASSIASADLGTIYACQNRDTVLWLKNPGCATLAVNSGSFTNASFSSDLTYPILIKAGDSVIVHVHVAPDTSGHPLSITGTFSLTSDADTGRVITIPLQVKIVYPAHLSISLSSVQIAGAGQSVTFNVSLAGAAPGVSALHFDLSNDDNLLSFVSASIPGVTMTGPTTGGPIGATRHFTLSPIPTPGVIGTLTFHSFLSTDSSTPLALSAVSFNNSTGVANDCIASVDDAGSSFQYRYSCGDGLIQTLMQSGTFKVDRIVPNPAKDEIRVYYTTTNPIHRPEGERKSIEFKIYDVLGQLRTRGEELELGGMISLDISDTPSGVYYLQIRIGAVAVTKRVVVAR